MTDGPIKHPPLSAAQYEEDARWRKEMLERLGKWPKRFKEKAKVPFVGKGPGGSLVAIKTAKARLRAQRIEQTTCPPVDEAPMDARIADAIARVAFPKDTMVETTNSNNGRVSKVKKAVSTPTCAELKKAAKQFEGAGDLSQSDKFEQAACDLECDPDDERFKGVLQKP